MKALYDEFKRVQQDWAAMSANIFLHIMGMTKGIVRSVEAARDPKKAIVYGALQLLFGGVITDIYADDGPTLGSPTFAV